MAILPSAKLTGEARTYQWLLSIASILIFLDLIFSKIGGPLILPLSAALFGGYWDAMPDALRTVGMRVIANLPAIFFLFGLSAAHDLLEEVAQGRLFTAKSARSLGGVGSSLLSGAFAAMFVSPNLTRWVTHEGGLTLAIETESLVIAGIGGTLAVVAHVVARAGALQSELSEII